VFVYGSNDIWAPIPHNPFRYFQGPSKHRRDVPELPWAELGSGLAAAGWLDMNNARGRIKAGNLDIEVGGVHDSHIKRDRYEEIAGPTDPSADLRLGVMHSPEPRVMDQFAADGYDLLLAGHTHGGQVCLPGVGALVTNCGIDRDRVSGLSRHPLQGSQDRPWLHVSAGLGTSPWAPVRFSCRPEASLLTLVPRIG
jgi:predicted MPP superfamily phosphohydrolase